MATNAQRERLLLADLLERTGPDAPTLCTGWTTRDLAVHLVIRERRSDVYLGKMVKRLAPRSERVLEEFRSKPFGELVELFRAGPPRMSPLKLNRVDELANTVEYFIHGEDIRRAQDLWEPRVLQEEFNDVLWHRIEQAARLYGRRSPVGLVLRRPDGQTAVAKRGRPVVTLIGEPSELLMAITGRTEQARLIQVEGDEKAEQRLRSAKMGI